MEGGSIPVTCYILAFLWFNACNPVTEVCYSLLQTEDGGGKTGMFPAFNACNREGPHTGGPSFNRAGRGSLPALIPVPWRRLRAARLLCLNPIREVQAVHAGNHPIKAGGDPGSALV